nr:basic form of pathogenesis-related protein 1-like [Ipomoea batatas]
MNRSNASLPSPLALSDASRRWSARRSSVQFLVLSMDRKKTQGGTLGPQFSVEPVVDVEMNPKTKMGLSKFPVALLSFMVIAILFHISDAQNSPPKITLNPTTPPPGTRSGFPHDMGRQLGLLRAELSPKSRAGDCNMVHSGGPYGENLAAAFPALNAAGAVKMWVDEKPKYDYNSNSCVGGECRHYTQVVWRSSVRLGCGKGSLAIMAGGLVCCSYAPRGNIIGQRPY